MGYLYGDATPFPLDENFIETLRELTEACVGLFRAETAGDARLAAMRSARSRADQELALLQDLGSAVQQAMTPFVKAGATSGAPAAAAEIGPLAQAAIRRASEAITATRDEVIRRSTSVDVTEEVRMACARFWIHHQLPGTRWGAEWAIHPGTERPTLTLFGFAPKDIHLQLVGEIPGESPWSEALKVSDMENDLTITMSKEPGLLGKSTRKEALHKMVVTRVEWLPTVHRIELHGNAKKASSGLRLTFRDGEDSSAPTVERLSAEGQVEGPAERLGSESGIGAARLWSQIERRAQALPGMRSSLEAIKLGPRGGEVCRQPQRLAELMLTVVAPLVLEMRKRSRVPGELGLKRELGDGRREELFVPRDELAQKFAKLPDMQRRVFEAIGLSPEATEEFTRQYGASSDQSLDQAMAAVEGADRDSTSEIVIEAGDPDDEIVA